MKSRPKWRTAEELVAMVEQALAPHAIVEHDVLLPVIGESRFRQCDVLLKLGQAPREQFFIVEVQKRHVKPDINTFGGWVDKMNEVGANGLICVSEVGFPQSIIDKVAKKIGPKVKLVTLKPGISGLKDLSGLNEIKGLVVAVIGTTWEVIVDDVGEPEPLNPELLLPKSYEVNTPLLSTAEYPETIYTLEQVCKKALNANFDYHSLSKEQIGKLISINVNLRPGFILNVGSSKIPLKNWKIGFKAKRTDIVYSKPDAQWSYSQESHGDVLAWVATSSVDIDGNVFEVRAVLVPDSEGYLKTTIAAGPNVILASASPEITLK